MDIIRKYVVLIVIGVLALILIFSSMVTVQSGTVGVVAVLGDVRDETMGPGFHLRVPFITAVTRMDIQTQKIEVVASAASNDLQMVSVSAAINYQVDPAGAPDLFRDVGMSYESRIIEPAIQEAIKYGVAQFTASELVTQRARVSAEIAEQLAARIRTYNIILAEMNITNFEFSDEFNRAVEAVRTAEQDALRAQQELIRVTTEAQQQVERARAEAEAIEALATAEAAAIIARADAEAHAIQVIQEQLMMSPDSYLEYQRNQQWDGRLPTVTGGAGMLIDGSSIMER